MKQSQIKQINKLHQQVCELITDIQNTESDDLTYEACVAGSLNAIASAFYGLKRDIERYEALRKLHREGVV